MEHTIRTKESWLIEANTTLYKCRWFIVKYFGEEKYAELLKLLEEKDSSKLYSELNDIWFFLPDSKFNILVNPEGWSEFLNLLEFWDSEEEENVLK